MIISKPSTFINPSIELLDYYDNLFYMSNYIINDLFLNSSFIDNPSPVYVYEEILSVIIASCRML